MFVFAVVDISRAVVVSAHKTALRAEKARKRQPFGVAVVRVAEPVSKGAWCPVDGDNVVERFPYGWDDSVWPYGYEA